MRALLTDCKKNGKQEIPKTVKKDIRLWVKFINKTTTQGVSLNNITFTKQTSTLNSDAFEHGIGGYTTNGRAWRYLLPTHLIGTMSINLLEFVAAAVTIVLTITETEGPHKPLALTDNSSALGWLYRASFPNSKETHNKVARWLASELLNNDAALYSQYVPGRHNAIADMLSRDHHISNDQLILYSTTFILNRRQRISAYVLYPPRQAPGYPLSCHVRSGHRNRVPNIAEAS